MRALLLLSLIPAISLAALEPEEKAVRDLVVDYCAALSESPDAIPPMVGGTGHQTSEIERRGAVVGQRYLWEFGEDSLRLDVIAPQGRPPRLVAERRNKNQPAFFIATDPACMIRETRRLLDDRVEVLGPWGEVAGEELLDAPLPVLETAANSGQRVRVAMVDSGVNYLLPEIQAGLATDQKGRVLGFDFWDMDARPFDAHPAASPFFVQRHGTRTASLMLRDAGQGVALVPYRYPRNNMHRMADLVRHADSLGVRIVGMPLGSNRQSDWAAFEQVAKAHPHMVFVASAGNGGRDIDAEPVYPAALDLDNLVVVSSAGDFAELADRVNYGATNVDYLLPAERQTVLEFTGEERQASGSSYAVSRMVAMLARVLRTNPGQSTDALLTAVRRFGSPARDQGSVAIGYLADPRAPGQRIWFELVTGDQQSSGLPIDLLVLDERWNTTEVKSAIAEASTILSQCDVTIGNVDTWVFSGPDYLRDLETGAAKTLFSAFEKQTGGTAIRLVLSRDTRMAMAFEAEAFGEGNTRTRRWLNQSLWIAYGAPDLGITIAHELFHVLANDGRHLPGNDNLMSAETNAGNTKLTEQQCAQIRG